ncbi:hypothetical protein CVT24_009957 [Panaeolus cyanescens]|uniref:Uncharacterized protein n=1 Tax=Panaeolus cyanescens TaxID=181874 RepID=A0A409VXI6_9AGAR|nr:hypothetical protein CVT24_009957 [Panaeolus cyanescens]
MPSNSPAHHTKHIKNLIYSFNNSSFILSQQDNGISNGTALWLGGQCLTYYLAAFWDKSNQSTRPKAIELGSGIGLTALALNSFGWDVLATDISHVIDSVLEANIKTNLPQNSGTIQVRELDWTVHPDKWCWNNQKIIASQKDFSSDINPSEPLLSPPFDLIYSADTVYLIELVDPLLRTLHALSVLSAASSNRYPVILLCIERRDPALVDHLLGQAKQKWSFAVERIPPRKLSKVMEKSGNNWDKSEWEGVELWKLKLVSTNCNDL